MQSTIRLCFTVLPLSAAVGTQAIYSSELTVGMEYYNEIYQEYEGSERMMQQIGNLWSLIGGAKYHFNDRHTAKVESHYPHGKSDYIGSIIDVDGNAHGYGFATLNGTPRRAYDIRTLYEYIHPINDRFSVATGAGLGHRVLRNLSSRADVTDYDRENQATYARINTGVNITLLANFEVSPRIAYSHALKGRQYSCHPGRETTGIEQSGRRSTEIGVPASKKFASRSKVSIAPFYRGWRVKKSDVAIVYLPQGVYSVTKPKNYTHEAGVRVQYSF